MIDPAYVRLMAGYNAWQNWQMANAMMRLTNAALIEDRGAFFASIMGTANHLLWGDMMWMSRFDGSPPPAGGIKESTGLIKTLGAWRTARERMDERIRIWAGQIDNDALWSRLSYHSQVQGGEITVEMEACVIHFFNHQTHHRGQIHAMLTAAGEDPGHTDLVFMPASGPWLGEDEGEGE